MWLRGCPSNIGQRLVQTILPEAVLFREQTASGVVFVVAHCNCHRPKWAVPLQSLCDVVARRSVPAVLPLRASFVYRTRSLDREVG